MATKQGSTAASAANSQAEQAERELAVWQTLDLISTGKAARLLNCSAAYVLSLTRAHLLSVTLVDDRHYFRKSDVEKFARARRTTDASIASVLRDSRVTVTAADLNRSNKERYAAEKK
jgi:hypothetical protein